MLKESPHHSVIILNSYKMVWHLFFILFNFCAIKNEEFRGFFLTAAYASRHVLVFWWWGGGVFEDRKKLF